MPKKSPKKSKPKLKSRPLASISQFQPWLLKWLPLILVCLLAFSFRLYRVNNPPLDWHAHRQSDTASVTREYTKRGLTLQTIFTPTYHDLSSIQSGQDNPEGYRMVEWPWPNILIAQLLLWLPFLPLVETSRVITILFSLISVISLFFIGNRYSGRLVGLLAAGIFAISPYIVYYSRALLPEPFMVATMLLAILAFDHWLKTLRIRWYLISLLSFTLALLLKPVVLFMAPIFLAMIYLWHYHLQIKQYILIGIYGTALVPLALWRVWIQNFPAGIPAAEWLLNSNGIRLRPAWFRWLGWERIGKLMLGVVGFIPLLFGFAHLSKKEIWFYGSWWVGVLLYLIIIATGNVQHDYYQYFITPILCLTVARGLVVIERGLSRRYHPIISWGGVAVLVMIMTGVSWQFVRGYFNVNHWQFVRAGQAVQRLTPENALVIAPQQGDTQLLYQTNRRGWPIGFEIEQKIGLGAQYYVSGTFDDEVTQLQDTYRTLEQTSEYVIIDLTSIKDQL